MSTEYQVWLSKRHVDIIREMACDRALCSDSERERITWRAIDKRMAKARAIQHAKDTPALPAAPRTDLEPTCFTPHDPRTHGARCAYFAGTPRACTRPATVHAHWHTGCGNLCDRHRHKLSVRRPIWWKALPPAAGERGAA